tara:strand:- start:344 stop:454 length:111 start_codon:yes stop_codon:yes gene_type:complete
MITLIVIAEVFASLYYLYLMASLHDARQIEKEKWNS